MDRTSCSALRLALEDARRLVNEFLLGVVVLGVLTSVASAVGAVAHPTLIDRLLIGLFGFALAVTVTLAVAFLSCLLRAPYKQRDELREMTKNCATFVPRGWNASYAGEQTWDGTWIPPGYEVKMAPGILTDDRGNTLVGGRIVGPGARNNTLIG